MFKYLLRLTYSLGKGGSPGLVVMGRDSRSKGSGFESQYRILDGHFFTYICCKNCNICLKRTKINEKEAGVGTYLKKTFSLGKIGRDGGGPTDADQKATLIKKLN